MFARLDGKVALVTGAGGDLGAETVRLMLERGAAVVGVDRSPEALGRVKSTLPADAPWLEVEADVVEEEQVADAVARAHAAFGRIDVLFNNAGVEGGPASAWRPTSELARVDFDHVFAVNVTGVFLCMKHTLPVMVAGGGGAIVNVASVAALRPGPGQMAYAASKAAVIGMTRTAALEWGEHGVRANCIAPGPLEGRMMESIAAGMVAARGAEPPGLRGAMIPMRRWGRPREVAGQVAYIASKHAVSAMTAVAAKEWAGAGVRVNAIAPGAIQGRMLRDFVPILIENTPPPREGRLQRHNPPPIERWSDPREIATLAVFLCSDDAGYMTGHTYSVDGGLIAL